MLRADSLVFVVGYLEIRHRCKHGNFERASEGEGVLKSADLECVQTLK